MYPEPLSQTVPKSSVVVVLRTACGVPPTSAIQNVTPAALRYYCYVQTPRANPTKTTSFLLRVPRHGDMHPYISGRSGVTPQKTNSSDTLRLFRGTIVNRTYGKHKNLYIKKILLTIFVPINYGPP